MLLSITVIFFIFKSLESNVVYFLSPTDIQNNQNINFDKKIRVGGLVKEQSINKKLTTVNFIITRYLCSSKFYYYTQLVEGP